MKLMNLLRLLCPVILLLCLQLPLSAQKKGDLWFYGLDLLNPNMTQFDFKAGKIGSAEQKVFTQIWLERRFNPKEKGPFKLQNGLRFELQALQREGLTLQNQSVQSSWFRIPVMWTQTMPRFYKDDEKPLFELQSGLGYHIAFSQYIEAGGQGVREEPSYWVHGLQGMLGINFYVQSGTMLNLSWRYSVDLGISGNETADPKLFYQDSGFSIGIASSFADTARRFKAMKNWRKARRK